MKTRIENLLCILAAVIVIACQNASGAVTFTFTPAAISNTYSGIITLQASGLTIGDTIVVQKFLDINTNNAVDAGDLLLQQFQLSDGLASVYTNGATYVTNFNVPGDTDGSANGSITAQLYPGLDFSQEIVGKYLYVFSSPAGHFTPQTNSFTVTNFLFAQSIAGVVSNTTAVANAVILLFQPQGANSQHPVAGTVANNAGAYSVKAPPGTYRLAAFKSNFVANLTTSPYVTLGALATITTNILLTNTTQTISGNVIDLNNSSVGLAGFLQPLQTSGNLLAVAFTDTNGNYTAHVTPDVWKVEGNNQAMALKGYLSLQNRPKVNTTTGNVAGVTLALPRATAIFYGRVTDNLGNPVPGVDIYSSDNNSYETDGFSFTNGNYVALAVGGLNNDQWQVQPSSDGNPTNYVFSQGISGVTLGLQQAYHYNFTALPATNHITGHVQDSFGNPLAGIGVNANNGGSYNAHTDTDANGNYYLNVANGYTWYVSLNCCDSCGDGLSSAYQCPTTQSVPISNNNGTANFIIYPASFGQIFGYLTDDYGNGVVGVSVYASDGLGDNYSTITTSGGYYSLGAASGTFTVSVDCGQLTARHLGCVDDDSAIVNTGSSVEADFMATNSLPPTYPFTLLYGFSATTLNPDGLSTNRDGANPWGGLALSGGTLYGLTSTGGTNGTGTVFGVNTTNLAAFAVGHTFAAQSFTLSGMGTNADGASSINGVTLSGGTLYGAMDYDGTNGTGAIFALSTNGSGFRIVHTFAAPTGSLSPTTNTDGSQPNGSLVQSGSMLYGTTQSGGANGSGVIFAVNTNGTGFTLLHTFSGPDPNFYTNSDGANPYTGLLLSGSTLFGTAIRGGSFGAGAVFAINTTGGNFTNLYNFNGGNDGASPNGLVSSGNLLYGATASGGSSGSGVIYAVNTNGTGFYWLHQFTGGADGAFPNAGMVLANNTLYGTTGSGGSAASAGTVFSVSVYGTNFAVLHSFTGGNDGASPYDDTLILSGGVLYGTTESGGANSSGTVFGVSISPSAILPVISQPTRSPGGLFQMLVTVAAGQSYTVQMSTNLASTNWASLLATNPPAGAFLFTDPNATNKQRCYRVLVGP